MKVLKKQGLTFVLIMALVVTLTLGIIFMLPAKTAQADDFTPDITVSTPKQLRDAIATAMSSNKTKIQLAEDIVLGTGDDAGNYNLNVTFDHGVSSDITIDLNGHTIGRNVTTNYGYVIMINQSNKLTLIDTSADKTGCITNGEFQWNNEPLVMNYGTLVTSVNYKVAPKAWSEFYDVETGSWTGQYGYIDGTTTNNACPAIFSGCDQNFANPQYSSWKKPSLIIKGGTFVGPASGLIINIKDSDLTIEDGTFLPNPEGYASNSGVIRLQTLMLRSENATDNETAKTELADFLASYNEHFRGAKVVIWGGDFTEFDYDYDLDKIFSFESEIKITNKNYWPEEVLTDEDGNQLLADISLVLEGGKWGRDISGYAPEGKWMELYDPATEGGSGDPYYRVVNADNTKAVASVTLEDGTENFYSTFLYAVEIAKAASGTRTIKLYKDVQAEELNFSNLEGAIILDLNEHKLKLEGEKRNNGSAGRIYMQNASVTLTVKDSSGTQSGELILSVPEPWQDGNYMAGGNVNSSSFITLDGGSSKFVLESGTIRQTGTIYSSGGYNYYEPTNSNTMPQQGLFHIYGNAIQEGAVTIKGGNVISELSYLTKEGKKGPKASPFFVVWGSDSSPSWYEYNFREEDRVSNKGEVFVFDLDGWINNGKTSVFSWNLKDGEDDEWKNVKGLEELSCIASSNGTFTFANVEEGDQYYVSGQGYSKISDAIEAAKAANHVITLLRAVTLSEAVELENITLDFDVNQNYTLTIDKNGSLTLKDGAILCNGTLKGSVTVDGDGDGNATMRDMTVQGDITVQSGTLSIPSGQYNSAFTINEGADLDITGGSFRGSEIENLDDYFTIKYYYAYIEDGAEYDNNTLYPVKIAPDPAAQEWYKACKKEEEFSIAFEADWNAFALYVSSGADDFRGKTVKLTADLDFGYVPASASSGAREATQPLVFIPAGNQTYGFNGTFDGGGHTIKGISVTEHNAGLFGFTLHATLINNITVADSVFIGGSGDFDEYNTERGAVYAGSIIAQGYHNHYDVDHAAKGIKVQNVLITQEQGSGDLFGGGYIGQTWSTLYIVGIEVDHLTLDGNWKMGGLIGHTEAKVTLVDATITDFNSLRGTYVGAVSGHANSGGGTLMQNCEIHAGDNALVGTMYQVGGSSDVVIEGADTYIEAGKLVSDNWGRTEESDTIIKFSSQVEDDGEIHRTTVVIGHGDEEEKLVLADEDGNELPEESRPKPKADGSLDMSPLVGESRIKVTVGGIILSDIEYNADNKATVNEVKFDLYNVENGIKVNLENVLHGELKLSVTLELSECTVGKQMALITSYNFSGDDAKNFNFQLTGNQMFIEVEVTAKTLQVSVNSNGEVEYDGFVGGENESVLGGTLTLDKVDNGDGTYTVTPSGLESENYNIVYVSSVVPATAFETESNALWIALAVIGSAVLLLGAVAVVYAVRKRRE